MVSLRWLTVLGFACVAAAFGKADAPADEMKKLEGTWLVESATVNGKTLDDTKGGEIVFSGKTITVKMAGGKEQKATYKVDPSKKPKTIDFIPEKLEPNMATGPGIYQLDGDTLKVCLGPPDKPRPTEFTDKGGPLFVLKRKK